MQIIQESIVTVKEQLSDMWEKLSHPIRDVEAKPDQQQLKVVITPKTKEINVGNYAFGIQGEMEPLTSGQQKIKLVQKRFSHCVNMAQSREKEENYPNLSLSLSFLSPISVSHWLNTVAYTGTYTAYTDSQEPKKCNVLG